MPIHYKTPAVIEAAGTKPKIIREYIGRVNSWTENISIAHMTSPQGWSEPGQQPEFDEYTLVLQGCLTVKTRDRDFKVRAGEAILVQRHEWVRYSTPDQGGADYIAICLPAFSPGLVHRDESSNPGQHDPAAGHR